ncbi:MAG: VWA domain-containing protein [Myxococcales bacterium]|nr:VWA domain-containing protein [Myxococcales bacterium]
MSFSFLAPAALGLLALALGPVVAHLTRQAIREERTFGATLLLERMRSRLERRRRLADRLLLLLRLSALILILLAITRPELTWPETRSDIGGTGRVIVVLDTSMSMDQRISGLAGSPDVGRTAFEAARAAATSTLTALPAGTRVAAVLTAPPLVVSGWSVGAEGDGAGLAAVLETVSRADSEGDLHGALVLARGLMGGEPAEVVIFTDEAGPGQVAACDQDLERIIAVGGAVVPRVFRPESPENVAIGDAAYGEGMEGGAITVSLLSFGEVEREVTTTLTLPGGQTLTSFVAVPGAVELQPGAAEVRFTVPRQAEGGIATITVDDSSLPADNVRSFHLPRIGASRVLVIDGDPGSTPTRSETYFLERALTPSGLGRAATDVVGPAGIDTLDPRIHRVVWMANVPDPAPLVPRLGEFVRKGGGLVIGMGENVTPERYNTAMGALLPLPLRRVRDLDEGGEGLVEGEPSSLLAPFRSAPGAFSKVRTRRVMTLEAQPPGPAAPVVVLKWSGGIPALVHGKVGGGSVLLWTGTLDLGWGNLPVEAVFPAMVTRLTAVLGGETGGGGAALNAVVGESVQVPVAIDAPELEVVGPDRKLRSAERSAGVVAFKPDVAGAWRVWSGAGEGSEVALIAVNTPPMESDVRHAESLAARQAALAPDRLLVHLDLARWLAVAGGLLIVLSTVWAAMGAAGARRPVQTEESNAPA